MKAQLPESLVFPCFVFVYDSWMNTKRLRETVGRGCYLEGKGQLNGWVRTFDGHEISIQRKEGKSVHGAIFEIAGEAPLILLAQEKPGYDLIDVTDSYTHESGRRLPESYYPGGGDSAIEMLCLTQDIKLYTLIRDPQVTRQVQCSLLEECMADMSEGERYRFMAETILPADLKIVNPTPERICVACSSADDKTGGWQDGGVPIGSGCDGQPKGAIHKACLKTWSKKNYVKPLT